MFSHMEAGTMRNKFSKSKRSRKQTVKGKRTRQFGSKRRSSHSLRHRDRAPRTARELFARPKQFQDLWNRVVNVVSKMRSEGVALRTASREHGLDPREVVPLAGSALRKRTNGRYVVRASDRLLRVLVIPTSDGLREIATRDSRQASLLANYWIAVEGYLTFDDSSALQEFKGKKIRNANGKKIPLLTDLTELSRLGSAGVLSFETVYAKR